MHIRKPSTARLLLCHLPEAFFNDLQTKSPEVFHPYSCVHPRWFTFRQMSPRAADPKPHRRPECMAAISHMRAFVPLFRRFDFSTFRRFLALPQPMPATRVATVRARLVSPYVTSENAPRRARFSASRACPVAACRLATAHQLPRHRRVSSPLHSPWTPCPAALQAPSPRPQVFSTQNHPKLEAPQHMPATALASVRQNFFRLLSPCKSHVVAGFWRPSRKRWNHGRRAVSCEDRSPES